MSLSLEKAMLAWLHSMYAFNLSERNRWVEIQASQLPAGTRVLDVGAGSCPYRSLFDRCEYETHDFVQLRPDQLSGGEGYDKIDYISDILSIPVQDASIDVVLCTEVLEHVPQPVQAIRELARILKPGGKLLLTAPLGSGLHQEPYHFYGGYTPHWYKKFLTECGFELITVNANGGFFKHYGQESLRFAQMMAPWHGWRQLTWLPFWLISLPWLILVFPLLGHLLDRLDHDKAFTVGYHVTAVRCH